jgi:hypothetical protein
MELSGENFNHVRAIHADNAVMGIYAGGGSDQ